ncbi:MAG: hypothetical protein ACKO9I_06935 [Sphaerospermopsis kisseleviana]
MENNKHSQSPVTSHQSPVTSHQSPVTSHQSPVPNISAVVKVALNRSVF